MSSKVANSLKQDVRLTMSDNRQVTVHLEVNLAHWSATAGRRQYVAHALR